MPRQIRTRRQHIDELPFDIKKQLLTYLDFASIQALSLTRNWPNDTKALIRDRYWHLALTQLLPAGTQQLSFPGSNSSTDAQHTLRSNEALNQFIKYAALITIQQQLVVTSTHPQASDFSNQNSPARIHDKKIAWINTALAIATLPLLLWNEYTTPAVSMLAFALLFTAHKISTKNRYRHFPPTISQSLLTANAQTLTEPLTIESFDVDTFKRVFATLVQFNELNSLYRKDVLTFFQRHFPNLYQRTQQGPLTLLEINKQITNTINQYTRSNRQTQPLLRGLSQQCQGTKRAQTNHLFFPHWRYHVLIIGAVFIAPMLFLRLSPTTSHYKHSVLLNIQRQFIDYIQQPINHLRFLQSKILFRSPDQWASTLLHKISLMFSFFISAVTYLSSFSHINFLNNTRLNGLAHRNIVPARSSVIMIAIVILMGFSLSPIIIKSKIALNLATCLLESKTGTSRIALPQSADNGALYNTLYHDIPEHCFNITNLDLSPNAMEAATSSAKAAGLYWLSAFQGNLVIRAYSDAILKTIFSIYLSLGALFFVKDKIDSRNSSNTYPNYRRHGINLLKFALYKGTEALAPGAEETKGHDVIIPIDNETSYSNERRRRPYHPT